MVREEALDWLEEAKVDLERVKRSIESADYSLACYLAQQAVDKAFKAYIIGVLRKRPSHVHDLTVLYNNLRDRLKLPNDIVERLPEISQYYVTTRYPNAGLKKTIFKL